ncbi:MAG: hypothetical protein EZS28_052811 [Streblomastix strix]|uniref:Uncharacterized protein n=1 Tax=Streblomastix strix TaxID=222440 RepID=A0A5J4RW63_9EUKA|nr:MAG: hypothetical protein EZS28_052811 [Streblomastix strix]
MFAMDGTRKHLFFHTPDSRLRLPVEQNITPPQYNENITLDVEDKYRILSIDINDLQYEWSLQLQRYKNASSLVGLQDQLSVKNAALLFVRRHIYYVSKLQNELIQLLVSIENMGLKCIFFARKEKSNNGSI